MTWCRSLWASSFDNMRETLSQSLTEVEQNDLRFQTVSNAVRMHHLAPLFSKLSMKFHIVSDAVRMHHLASLFSKFSLQFQIISNAVKMHPLPSLHVFKIISVIPNCFKYRQKAPFSVIVFKISRRLPWSSCFPLVLVQHMYYFSY